MEIHNLLDVKSRTELREWLIQNHKTEKECWVVVKRGRPTDDNTSHPERNISKLLDYARQLRVGTILENYLQVKL